MSGEDWYSQLVRVMGERDTDDLQSSFNAIVQTHEEQEPLGWVQIAVDETEVHAWLPATVTFLKEMPANVSEEIQDMIWNLGIQLLELYLESEDIAPTAACAAAVQYFIETAGVEIEEPDNGEE